MLRPGEPQMSADSGVDEGAEIIACTAWVQADAPWILEQFIKLLPQEAGAVERINEFTVAVAYPDFVKISAADIYRRMDTLIERLTALMHAYSPNTVRRLWISQIHTRNRRG